MRTSQNNLKYLTLGSDASKPSALKPASGGIANLAAKFTDSFLSDDYVNEILIIREKNTDNNEFNDTIDKLVALKGKLDKASPEEEKQIITKINELKSKLEMYMILDDNFDDLQCKLEMIEAKDTMYRQNLSLKVNETNSLNQSGLSSPEACISKLTPIPVPSCCIVS